MSEEALVIDVAESDVSASISKSKNKIHVLRDDQIIESFEKPSENFQNSLRRTLKEKENRGYSKSSIEEAGAEEGEEKKESKKKTTKAKPGWVKVKPEELEKIAVELAKNGESPAKIGVVLRDQHGVPRAKMFGKKIVKILKENNVDYKTDKQIVEERAERLRKHSEKHKHDSCSSRALTKNLWAITRLSKGNY